MEGDPVDERIASLTEKLISDFASSRSESCEHFDDLLKQLAPEYRYKDLTDKLMLAFKDAFENCNQAIQHCEHHINILKRFHYESSSLNATLIRELIKCGKVNELLTSDNPRIRTIATMIYKEEMGKK